MFLYRAHRQSSASPAPLGHGKSPYRRPLSTAPNCTTGSWHVTVPQATLHCPTLHHWVMARHRTAGHSPLPHSAPLGHGTSPYRRPLSTLHHWVMARHRTAGHSPLPQTAPASLAKWLRRPPREREVPGSNPASAGIFFGVESYQ